MRVESIEFKDGTQAELGALTALIGPNNSGKSQMLRDIVRLIPGGVGQESIVLSNVRLSPMNRDHDSIIEELGLSVGNGQVWIGPAHVTNWSHPEAAFRATAPEDIQRLVNLSALIIRRLGVDDRLEASRGAVAMNYLQPEPTHPLQHLAVREKEVLPQLDTVIRQTFGVGVMIDDSSMMSIHLRVSREFPSTDGLDRITRAQVMAGLLSADQQGDGFRSFLGVVLPILLENRKILLIDEPDAFLHPAQARMLGHWIAVHAGERGNQVILATHNENLLQGLLAGNSPPDLTILRLDRSEEDLTSVTVLPRELLRAMAVSPLLSAQAFMHGLFQRGVVVVEAPNDRAVYERVAAVNAPGDGIVFINAQNKQTLKDIIHPLATSGVPVAAIADFDILVDHRDFSALVRALDATQVDELVAHRKEIFQDPHNDEARDDECAADLTLLEELRMWVTDHDREQDVCTHGRKWLKNRLGDRIQPTGFWDQLKVRGMRSLPPELQDPAAEFLNRCEALGLFIVPVGELESWFDVPKSKESISHMLQEIQNGNHPDSLNRFIRRVIEYVAGAPDGHIRQTALDPASVAVP